MNHPPAYSLVNRVYRSSLRPVVLPLALLTGIWTLVWSIGLFKEIGTVKSHGEKKLGTFAIALGAIYAAVSVIEFFGVAAAGFQRYALIRIYAFLSVAAAVMIVGAGLLRVIIHFMLKDDLLSECTTLATGQHVDFRWGIWGPHIDKTLTRDEAVDWCNSAWKHDSVSEIVSLIVEIVFVALLTTCAFSYSHQVSPDTFTPPARLDVPNSYNPSYAATNDALPNLGYGAPYAPPAGPPPGFHDADGKPPGYGVGVGSRDKKSFDEDLEDGKDDDPFADFEGPPRH